MTRSRHARQTSHNSVDKRRAKGSKAVLATVDHVRACSGERVRVGDVVVVSARRKGNGVDELRGLVRRTYTTTPTGSRTVYWAHIHFLARSDECGLVLQHLQCRNVRAGAIVRRVRDIDAEPSIVLQADAVWRDALPPGAHSRRAHGDPFSPTRCDGCLSAAAARHDQPRVTPLGLRSRGKTFHIGDLVFVELDDAVTGQPWTPALLITASPCVVRLCGRIADLDPSRPISPLALYLRDEECDVAAGSIMTSAPLGAEGGYTLRKRLPRYAPRTLASLVGVSSKDMVPCGACAANAAEKLVFTELRLTAADLYAGGGGSVAGVNKHFSVRLAVDADGVAVSTLRANFPRTRVVCSTVADFLAGKCTHLPPAPGTLALLVAGPPCQGHTRINHGRCANDARNGEIEVALDAVGALRPDVFVLENVEGFNDAGTGGVNFAHEAVKRLVRELGYQVRVGLLDSREFGSAQQRRRVFVLAARRDMRLPSFPAPTHANPSPKLLTFTLASPLAFGQSRGRVAGTAPLPAITARDALGDFPRWEYPLIGRGVGSEDKTAAAVHVDGGVGVPDGTPMRAARTDYQRAARRGGHGVTLDHVTDVPGPTALQNILSAPRVGTESPGLEGKFRRAHPDRGVPTLLSSPWPGHKGTGVVHWSQHRVFTVAERRRLMGLPDNYVLAGSVKEQNRMLGNMIDTHVAEAVAAQIKDEVYGSAWRAWGCPDTATFWRRWRRRHPVELER